MKKGIQCNEYIYTGVKKQNRIVFRFVSEDDDREIPSYSSISLGDEDPMTGERLDDLSVFRDYNLMRNREVYHNLKAITAPVNLWKKEERQKLKDQIAAEFEREYGYAPDKDSLLWLLHQKMPKEYRLEIDSLVDEQGHYWTDHFALFTDGGAERALQEVEEEGHTLDGFARTLSPLCQDVFRMLRMKSEGIDVRGMGKQLAEKWGVDKSDISKMKLRIGKLLMEWMKESES